MSASIETSVQSLVDRAAIHDVLARYARAVDRRDLDGVASCFTADAAYKGSLGEGTIDVALRALRERMRQYSSTMHFLGNQLVEISGADATSETYAIAYHQLEVDGVPKSMAVGVRYLDSLTRTSTGWLICRREVKLEWRRLDDLVAQ